MDDAKKQPLPDTMELVPKTYTNSVWTKSQHGEGKWASPTNNQVDISN